MQTASARAQVALPELRAALKSLYSLPQPPLPRGAYGDALSFVGGKLYCQYQKPKVVGRPKLQCWRVSTGSNDSPGILQAYPDGSCTIGTISLEDYVMHGGRLCSHPGGWGTDGYSWWVYADHDLRTWIGVIAEYCASHG